MATLNEKTNNLGDGSSVTLTIRLIMQGKEVGSIIGKKGDNIKRFREESGAKINISDGSCPERIVTVTGATDAIFKAFSMICKKFEEDLQNADRGQNVPVPPITLRLIVPASQCGSLIGKGGSKIKEIREVSGASIQVASEMLPNSTERAVTISGTSEAITQCIYHICSVMLESPPKGATIPYRPKPAMPPVIFAGGQAYTIQGQYAIPQPDLTKLHQLALQHSPGLLPGHNIGSLTPQAALALAATNQITRNPQQQQPPAQTQEMSIPNDLIGCVIGKGGAKINEIRQVSGANIKISNSEEGTKDRSVTISGSIEAVSMAQYLINTSMELHKQLTQLSESTSSTDATAASTDPTSSPPTYGGGAIPLNQLMKPATNLLSLTSAASIFEQLGLAAGLTQPNRKNMMGLAGRVATGGSYSSKPRGPSSSASNTSPSNGKRSDRNKFSPY